MAVVHFQQVGKVFPGPVEAVTDFDLETREGELLTLVGPSGCGKTTLLRMVAGLETPSKGTILLDGVPLAGIPPHRRDVAMVFQDYALYPHLSVAKNMSFGLERHGIAAEQVAERVREAAQWLEIEPLLTRRPAQLSGGERQRVALGRAVVRRPRVFLFDEPLANLDAQLRDRARTEIARLQQQLGATSLYVTHDQSEALALGDRVAVMSGGKLQQVGPPRDVYERPANRFVASFIGRPQMNFLPGWIEGGTYMAEEGQVRLSLPTDIPDGPVDLGVRPEAIELGHSNHSLGEGLVRRVEWLGDHALVHLRVAQADWVARVAPERSLTLNSTVPVAVCAGGLHLFAAGAEGIRITSF